MLHLGACKVGQCRLSRRSFGHSRRTLGALEVRYNDLVAFSTHAGMKFVLIFILLRDYCVTLPVTLIV